MAFLWLSRPKPEPAGRNCLMCVRQAKYAGQKLCTPKHNYASVKGSVYVCVCVLVCVGVFCLLACLQVGSLGLAWAGVEVGLGNIQGPGRSLVAMKCLRSGSEMNSSPHWA